MSSGEFLSDRLRVSHRTVRLCLLLLPVWVFGAGELGRFGWNSMVPGPFERNGMIKGRDFVQFYVAGTLARQGEWQALYDVAELEHAVARVVPPAAGEIPAPLYGPQVALFFAPWSRLPYIEARWWWCAASALLYLLAAGLVIRTSAPLRGRRVLAWITVVCNPAFAMLLATGQTGAMGVLAWALAAAALAKGRPVLIGASLGLLAYKPPLLIGAVPVLMILGAPAALGGLLISVVGQGALSAIVTGCDPWRAYAGALASVSRLYYLTDTLPHQKQSLTGFFQLLAGTGTLATLLSVLGAVGVLALWWRHRGHGQAPWFLPMLAVTTILLSPHLYVYDLVVLTPALLVVSDALSRGSEGPRDWLLAWAAYAALLAPFSGAFALLSRVQLSTLVFVVLLIAIHREWMACICRNRRNEQLTGPEDDGEPPQGKSRPGP